MSGLQHETSPAAGHEVKDLSKDLSGGGRGGDSDENTDHHHHLSADDDDRVLASQQQTENEKYNRRVDEYREKVLTKFRGRADEEVLNAALDIIDQAFALSKASPLALSKSFAKAAVLARKSTIRDPIVTAMAHLPHNRGGSG